MNDSNPKEEVRCKVNCAQHGDICSDLDRDPADELVADLLRRQHLEECAGPVEIVELPEAEFERASEIADRQRERHANGPGNHCPECFQFVSRDRPTTCSRCGKVLQEDQNHQAIRGP